MITPWDVRGGADGRIDYDKLRRDVRPAAQRPPPAAVPAPHAASSGGRPGAQFGCAEVDDALVRRMERLTGVPAHPFLKRRVFYAHRDLAALLDAYEKGEPFYLYTGRVRRAAGAPAHRASVTG